METIAERMQEAREMAGLSIGQVARMLGVERAIIEQAEQDDTAALAILEEVANLYDVNPAWLRCEVYPTTQEVFGDTPIPASMSAADVGELTRLLGALRRG